jgi:hypothetical protein
VKATRTGLLAFVATARRFAQARTNTATDAAAIFLGALGGLDGVQFHDLLTLISGFRFPG